MWKNKLPPFNFAWLQLMQGKTAYYNYTKIAKQYNNINSNRKVIHLLKKLSINHLKCLLI